MSSLRRLPGSQFWIACYTDGTGRRRQRSTKMLDRRKALLLAEQWEGVFTGRQTETQVRRVMSDIFEEVHKTPLSAYTLGSWATEWLKRSKPEFSQKTHDRYSEVVRTVRKFAPELLDLPIDRVEPKGVLELRNRLFEVRAAATVNQVLKVMKSCVKAGWDAGVVADNAFARVKRVRPDEGVVQKQPFTVEQIKALLTVADDEWRGMIFTGLYSGGQRLGDICTLRVRQIDLAGGVVHFTTDKTGRQVEAPIVAPWRADLAKRVKRKAAEAYVFPRAARTHTMADGRPVDVSKSFRRLLHKIGLAPKVGPRAGAIKGRRVAQAYSFHSFRHTATSMLKNAGVSDSVTRDIVGHESVAVSRVYTHIDAATKRAAMERLPTI